MGEDANHFSGDSLDGNEKKKKGVFVSLVFSGAAKSDSGTDIQTKW